MRKEPFFSCLSAVRAKWKKKKVFFVDWLRIACICTLLDRTLLLRSYFCKKEKRRADESACKRQKIYTAQEAESLFKQSLTCITVFTFFFLFFWRGERGKKILTRGAAKQNATLCIGYRYVSIYVYSLHPLKKHISCTFFTVCSHILSRVHVLARALCRRGPAPCTPAAIYEVEAFTNGGKRSVVSSDVRRLFICLFFVRNAPGEVTIMTKAASTCWRDFAVASVVIGSRSYPLWRRVQSASEV